MSLADVQWSLFLFCSLYILTISLHGFGRYFPMRITFVLCARKFFLLHSLKTLLHCRPRFVYLSCISAVIAFFFPFSFLFKKRLLVVFKRNKCYFQLKRSRDAKNFLGNCGASICFSLIYINVEKWNPNRWAFSSQLGDPNSSIRV